MSVVLFHPTGNPNSLALARALCEAEMLESFVTGLRVPRRLAEAKLLPAAVRAELGRRVMPGLPRGKTDTEPVREIARVLAARRPASLLSRSWLGPWASVAETNRRVAVRAGRLLRRRPSVDLVYGYEDAALEAFEAAAARPGSRRVLELPIADWRTTRRVLSAEREHAPEWAATIETIEGHDEGIGRKDAEIALAHHIVAPSRFVQQGLRESYSLSTPVTVIPYGAPPVSPDPPAPRRVGEPLEVVYVGGLRQRKGISYLLEGVRLAGRAVRLTLVGPRPSAPCAPLDRALAEHRWLGRMPHASVLPRLRECHVMVFPSLVEGFALVVLEAMAQGVPVVTTPNSGACDVIEDSVDGFVVPVRDPPAIADRLLRLHADEELRMGMAVAAKRKAGIFSWTRYGEAMVDLLRSVGARAG